MKLHPSYEKLRADFGSWLTTLGYVPYTVYSSCNQLREFLLWLQKQQKTDILQLQAIDIVTFIEVFKNRPNKRRGGGLSAAHINKQIDCLKKLLDYLAHFKGYFIQVHLSALPDDKLKATVFLSQAEIQALYAGCDDSLLGLRDRAMLGIYYGCGLRRGEGENLDVDQLHLQQQRLKVSKSKTGRPRFVPIAPGVLKDLNTYLYEARPFLAAHQKQAAFFISTKGRRIQSYTLYLRLKTLAQKAHITQPIGIHTLRHSIASHLLEQGMSLEHIGRFLGHRCLDSTQLYTHLIQEKIH